MDVAEDILERVIAKFQETHPYEEPWYEISEKHTLETIFPKNN